MDLYFLTKLRKERRLTQKELSELIEMDLSSYSRVETGKRQLKLNEFEKICKILDLDIHDRIQLISGEDII